MTQDELGSCPKFDKIRQPEQLSKKLHNNRIFTSAFVDDTHCCSTIRADDNVFVGPLNVEQHNNGKNLFAVYVQISNRRQIRDKGMINPITSEECTSCQR